MPPRLLLDISYSKILIDVPLNVLGNLCQKVARELIVLYKVVRNRPWIFAAVVSDLANIGPRIIKDHVDHLDVHRAGC